MFNSLRGSVSGFDFPQVYLTTGGVEWEIEVSAAGFRSIVATEDRSDVSLFVHLYVREDQLKLYGFAEESERKLFRHLLTVNGVGPRQAIKILSGSSVDGLLRALENDDIDTLSTIPGLGKKTAQKILLQLKGHLVQDTTTGRSAEAAPTARDDLVEALVEMGFDRSVAVTVIGRLRDDRDDPTSEEEIFRRAIVELSTPR